MPSKEKSTFSRFFKEDAETVQDIIYSGSGKQHDIVNKVGTANKAVLPRIAQAKSKNGNNADQANQELAATMFKTRWQSLRSFFRNANNTVGLPDNLTPAILSPLYTGNLVGTDFPVWVADEKSSKEGPFCVSLIEILTGLINKIGPKPNDAHILKENIERLIHITNEIFIDGKPQHARPVIHKALYKLQDQLDVSGDELIPFKNDLKELMDAVPENGVLLPYSNNTSLNLLEAAILATLGQARKELKGKTAHLKGRLQDVLRVEREKDPGRKDPEILQESMEFADSMMDFDQLSSILPGSSSEIMRKGRQDRINHAIEELEAGASLMDRQCFFFIDELLYDSKNIEWDTLLGSHEITVYKKGQGCDVLATAFEKHIAAWTNFFKAKRIGELELENLYQDEVHDDFFNHFDWQIFSKEELNNCPYFILTADDIRLFETEFSKLASMLSANVPIKVVAVKRDISMDEDQADYLHRGSAWHANTELGALMLSYKNIYIAQSSSITPIYLFREFKEGLSAFSPAFFYLLNSKKEVRDNAYLWTSANVESRDFPGFTYRGLLGTPWGSRFDVSNNPQPDLPWPIYSKLVLDEKSKKVEMQFAFTFADHAAINAAYHHHFMPVEPAYWSDDLIPLTDYIDNNVGKYDDQNSIGENLGKIPYIWMMDATYVLHKVAVSWQMVLASQERLDFWKFLQENSGINNYHVSAAVEEAKIMMQVELEQEIERIRQEHAEEMQKVRDDEAGKVMENLTAVLLDLDTSHVTTRDLHLPDIGLGAQPEEINSVVPRETSEAAQDANNTATDMESTVEEDIPLTNDPYIDTALCTSCNECTELNGEMFKYDGDKLAYLADPKAGTFRDLVEAAEVCPVAIIHPGSPLNPDEDDLENLIARAEKFN